VLKTLIGGPKLEHLLELLRRAMRSDVGAIVEFGVYHGGTLKIMAESYPDRMCYGFDTWDGLPVEKWVPEEPHSPGDFRDCDFESMRAQMPTNVRLYRGTFPESAAGINPRVAFAHVDFDFHSSTADAIRWLKLHMIHGGIAVFDDYDWPHCPGVKRAITEAGLMIQKSTPNQVFWVKP